jgi:sugar/nucleoside kinase (ribokinase family)
MAPGGYSLVSSRLMTLTVVGSIAFDAVETPMGKRDRLLGGAAVHFSLASSFLAETRVVGPVGDDFGEPEYAVLHERGVITDDIEHVPGGKTFFWAGRYERDPNIRHTLQTDLNVFEHFEPKLSEASRAADTLFLANIHPGLQHAVHTQCREARFVAMDTMNMWIEVTRPELEKTIAGVDCLIVNDEEVKQLTDEPNLVRAARAVHAMGPRVVIAKQGEYGASLFTEDGFFALPAYPLETVRDPTGAGDSFAGGLMGYLDSQGGAIDDATLRRAMVYGSTLASFWVEEFGCERAEQLTREEIDERYEQFKRITAIESVPAR